MFSKGDKVRFIIGSDKEVRTLASDTYLYAGVEVVDIEGYAGEVGIHYIEKVSEGETSDK